MSVLTRTKDEPKVHFSEYIRTNNHAEEDTKPGNPIDEDTPTTPEAE